MILDASESAQEYRQAIADLANNVIEQLPAWVDLKLCFLSNSHHYPVGSLAKNLPAWWRENSSRGSFLTPILRTVDTSRVVVIGSGRIYDLEDWRGTEVASNLLLAMVGHESLQGGTGIVEEMQNPDPSQVVSRLLDRVLKIEITGKGFMPFSWNNPNYKLDLEDKATLTADNPDDPTVSLAFFGSNVKAQVWYTSGSREKLLEAIDFDEVDRWEFLPEIEAEAVMNAVQGKKFLCPRCGQEHPSQTIQCDTGPSSQGTFLPKSVYPSLERTRGFVFFRNDGEAVLWRHSSADTVRVGPRSVAVKCDRTALLYTYDDSQEKWNQVGEIRRYQQVSDGYMLVI